MPPRILDRLVPPAALRWGRLTHESDRWHIDAVRWQLANIPATITRPCPAYDRLDALMAGNGKVTRDGWTSAAFSDWWSYQGGRS